MYPCRQAIESIDTVKTIFHLIKSMGDGWLLLLPFVRWRRYRQYVERVIQHVLLSSYHCFDTIQMKIAENIYSIHRHTRDGNDFQFFGECMRAFPRPILLLRHSVRLSMAGFTEAGSQSKSMQNYRWDTHRILNKDALWRSQICMRKCTPRRSGTHKLCVTLFGETKLNIYIVHSLGVNEKWRILLELQRIYFITTYF